MLATEVRIAPPAETMRLSASLSQSDRLPVEEGRQFRTLVRHEHSNQFSRCGDARIGENEMHRARRLKERLSNLDFLHGVTLALRSDLAVGDMGSDRAPMAVRQVKPPGP